MDSLQAVTKDVNQLLQVWAEVCLIGQLLLNVLRPQLANWILVDRVLLAWLELDLFLFVVYHLKISVVGQPRECLDPEVPQRVFIGLYDVRLVACHSNCKVETVCKIGEAFPSAKVALMNGV